MDRLQAYLEIVPLPVLILAAMFAIVAFVATPTRLRLPAALVILPIWMSVNQFSGLGTISAVAKATGFIAYLIVAIAAFLHPGPRAKIPFWGWIPVVLAVPWAIVAMLRGDILEFVLQFQWLILCVAALLTARLATDFDTMLGLLRPIAFGFAGSVAIAGSSLIIAPAEAFASGLGRVQPWGANQNQIGTALIMGTSLLVFFGLVARAGSFRVPLIAAAGFSGLLSLMTASRSVVFTTGLILLPVLWHLRKKPIVVAAGALGVMFALYLGASQLQETSLERLQNLESERWSIWPIYINYVISNPILGVGLQPIENNRPIDAHSHMAYLEVLFMFGIPLAIGMVFYSIVSCLAAFRLWLACRKDAHWGITATFVCNLLILMYVHGFATTVLFYPTYAWGFIAMFLSLTVMSFEKAIRTAPALDYGYDDYDPQYAAEHDEQYSMAYSDSGNPEPSRS